MKDLEIEFENLIKEVYKSINHKYDNYEYSYNDKNNMIAFIKEKTGIDPVDTGEPSEIEAWESSANCFSSSDDDGWQSSMGYKC